VAFDGDAEARCSPAKPEKSWNGDGVLLAARASSNPLSLAGVVERPRPHSEGAIFWPHNSEGNHGEDAKSCTTTLTPHRRTRIWKCSKYPQQEFPYARLRRTGSAKRKQSAEFELLDTGILDDDRYFDVFVDTPGRGRRHFDAGEGL